MQAEVEHALKKLTGKPIRITGAGRTDEGAHAWGQVATLELPGDFEITTSKVALGLNRWLPPEVRVRLAEDVPERFHAQVSASGKIYRYHIFNAPGASALLRHTHWHVRFPLDFGLMQRAAKLMTGKQNYAALATNMTDIQARRKAAGREPVKTEREISRLELSLRPAFGTIAHEKIDPAELKWPAPRVIWIEVEGAGFMYKMVRTIAGTLAEIGRGRWPVERVKEALASGDRGLAGPTAPAKGLCLMEVKY